MICCCTDTPNDQSDGRTPHPDSSPGSKLAPTVCVPPNARLLIWAHVSTLPVVVGPCASGLFKSQSGTKSRSLSVQLRAVDGANVPPNVVSPPGAARGGG